jgi:hypothetical protein
MMNERLSRVKTGAIDETRKLFWIFLYLFVLLSLFSFYKALILNEETLIYHQGFALINALALAKVMLVGEYLHVGDNFKNRPLIYPIIFKSAVFAVLLVCFHIIEESFIGVLRGKTLSQSVPSIGGGTLEGIVGVGIIMFVVLMPFFAFRELDRVIGTENYALSYLETRPRSVQLRQFCGDAGERLPPLSPFSRSGAVGSPGHSIGAQQRVTSRKRSNLVPWSTL